MVCTGPTAKWTDTIPRPKLIEELKKKTKKIARSDKSEPGEPSIFRRTGATCVEVDIPI
jgi:hypothetical protein